MYQIEKNINMPVKGKGDKYKATRLRDFLNTLEVGDSFILPKEEYSTFGNAKKFVRDKDIIFTARRLEDKNFRIFRVA